ncbi:hypothetical protein PRUPE_2G055300 [Prunus persica]|uniref:RING-type domain-containing protein n=1 Tax=Prunus persica TaxID=3760 RepID=A0A251QBS8_PRUPE|nr:hypothetical protein PRUPE_2G055300 [Prunus persica]
MFSNYEVLICLAEYDGGDKIRVLLCCDEFHMECIDKWLKEKQGNFGYHVSYKLQMKFRRKTMNFIFIRKLVCFEFKFVFS